MYVQKFQFCVVSLNIRMNESRGGHVGQLE